jgi:hypothetical protein
MKMSHRNSMYSYLKQTKMSFYFSFTNYRAGEWNRFYLGGLVPVGGQRMWRKGVGE